MTTDPAMETTQGRSARAKRAAADRARVWRAEAKAKADLDAAIADALWANVGVSKTDPKVKTSADFLGVLKAAKRLLTERGYTKSAAAHLVSARLLCQS